MFEQLTQYNNLGIFILRLAVAVVFIYHALPKFKNAKMMGQGMGMPAFTVLILGAVEFGSSLGLIFSIYTKVAALLLSVVMLGAIYFKVVKWHIPFMAMDKTGWEFDFILLAANVSILLAVAG